MTLSEGRPLNDPSHAYYLAVINGGNDQSIQEIMSLLEQDPLSIERLLDLSRMYLYAGRYSDVIEIGNKILELSPDNTSARRHLGSASFFSENFECNALRIFAHSSLHSLLDNTMLQVFYR